MEPTDTGKPDYFHRVVDCQWACPAHTDVPEYIRLIAQGEFTEAYMVNRASNVFPGILGRVCDRPCEPACRRGRIEEKPVAICRLKRVAADQRDDITALLPTAPQRKERQARRLHRRGTGLAHGRQRSVAAGLRGHDLRAIRRRRRPDAHQYPGIPPAGEGARRGDRLHRGHGRGPARSNAPVDEHARVARVRTNSTRCSSAPGAPKGKELELPGRHDTDRVHIGITWLESVAFGHVDKIGERVLIIGVGNTAMDCCRSSLRLGAKDVKVMARKPRQFFKASEWELEDAEHENVADHRQSRAQELRGRGRAAQGHDVRADSSTTSRTATSRRPACSARSSSRATT